MTSTIEAAPGSLPVDRGREGRRNRRWDSVRSSREQRRTGGGRHGRFRRRQSPKVDIVIDPGGALRVHAGSPRSRPHFEQSAARLLASDGWSGGGAKELVADLALEGGGVKGIGIVGAVSVLAEAGYRFAAGGRHERRRHRGGAHRGDLEEGRPHDEPEGLPRQPDLHRVHATEGQAARVHGPPLRERRREAVGCRGPHPPDGCLRRRLPRHVARSDHARPRRAHLRRPQDHDGGRSRHEPPGEPTLRARRAHVRHHPRPAGPPALGLRLLRAEP